MDIQVRIMTPQKWRHFEDQYTPVIQVQTPPLEGPTILIENSTTG